MLINAIALATFTHSLAILAVGPPIYAEFPPKRGTYQVYVSRVIDGDTIEFYHLVPDSGRLHGCNAAELPEENGKAAAGALAAMLRPGTIRPIELVGREKFGRVLFRAQLETGGDVTAAMIAAGHARPWDGKGPRP
jgi:endonuclease YncB( thermonuclease family)